MSEAMAVTLALGGVWRGGRGMARCPAHDDGRPSLSVGEGHDGRLLLQCFAGCAFADILAALRARGIVGERAPHHAPDPEAAGRRAAKARGEQRRMRESALRVWNETRPATGTLAERYLRGRAIRCPLPETVRFHPACWHGATARRHPALVARVETPGGFAGIHRTFLREPGRKAGLDPAKTMLGPVRGGAVRLSRGPGPVVVAEGIETAASLRDRLASLEPTVLAALSASGMAALELPGRRGDLIIAPDGDKAGREAAARLLERARAAGWTARIMEPPAGGLDWNDLAMKEAARECA